MRGRVLSTALTGRIGTIKSSYSLHGNNK